MIDLHTHTSNSDGDFTTEETINEIMKKAESNKNLLKWSKLIIIKECKLALFDLAQSK